MITNSFMKDGVPTVTPQDVRNLKGAQLIDVRRPDEYVGELGHIAGSTLITLGPELNNFLAKADKNSAIVFICRSGARSGTATVSALSQGIKQSYNMEGGMLAWNGLGLPVIYENIVAKP